jgi:hypothetical protein
VAKNLSESLFGVVHHDEEKLPTVVLAQTCVEEPNQVRVGQLGRCLPMELCQCDSAQRG